MERNRFLYYNFDHISHFVSYLINFTKCYSLILSNYLHSTGFLEQFIVTQLIRKILSIL